MLNTSQKVQLFCFSTIIRLTLLYQFYIQLSLIISTLFVYHHIRHMFFNHKTWLRLHRLRQIGEKSLKSMIKVHKISTNKCFPDWLIHFIIQLKLTMGFLVSEKLDCIHWIRLKWWTKNDLQLAAFSKHHHLLFHHRHLQVHYQHPLVYCNHVILQIKLLKEEQVWVWIRHRQDLLKERWLSKRCSKVL